MQKCQNFETKESETSIMFYFRCDTLCFPDPKYPFYNIKSYRIIVDTNLDKVNSIGSLFFSSGNSDLNCFDLYPFIFDTTE